MIELLIIPYMAIVSGWSGGSLWGHQLFPFTWMPEVLFAVPFGLVWFYFLQDLDITLYQSVIIKEVHHMKVGLPFEYVGVFIIVLWSYIFMQTGHANALPWGSGEHNPDRENTLSPVVKWFSRKLNIEYYSKNFARLFMAVKGFLITLPVGGLGLILWPLGYELGDRAGKNNVLRELASGAGAGVAILIGVYVF